MISYKDRVFYKWALIKLGKRLSKKITHRYLSDTLSYLKFWKGKADGSCACLIKDRFVIYQCLFPFVSQ